MLVWPLRWYMHTYSTNISAGNSIVDSFMVCQFSVAEVVMLVLGQQGGIGGGWMGQQLT
jgi:hypothetical protein